MSLKEMLGSHESFIKLFGKVRACLQEAGKELVDKERWEMIKLPKEVR